MKKTNVNMLSGSIAKGLLAMAIPVMIMNALQSVFVVVDMSVLKAFSNDVAVGSVGACSYLITLFTSLLIGVSTGANVILARRFGAGERERADRAVMTSLLLSVLGGAILMIVGICFAEGFLMLVNCPTTLLPKATLYFKLYFCGVPMLILYNFCAAMLRAIGDAKTPMYLLIFSGLIKTGLTIFIVACFGMDVVGVGIATISANTFLGVLSLVLLKRHKESVSVNFKRIRFDTSELKDILMVGIPAGLQNSLYSVANVVIVSVVNSFGAAASTGDSIANNFDNILYHIVCATAYAATPYVAQNIGAGNISRASKVLSRGILITSVFGLFFGSLCVIFSPQLASLMTSDPQVISFACQKMLIVASTYFICGINELFGGVLRGMGRAIYPTITALAFLCGFRFFWVYLIFPYCQNFTFLYACWPIGWSLSVICLLGVYIPTLKKLKANSNKELS